MSLETAVRPLQFDTAKPAKTAPDVAAAEHVTCASCKSAIAYEYYDVNTQTVCGRCRHQLAEMTATPEGLGVFSKALLFGLVAAILGAIVYYAVVKITNFEIGLVAIAIGFMVGYAIRTATGNRGGLRFQFLAVVLTYWAVGLSYMPFAFEGMKEDQAKQAQSAPATPGAAAADVETVAASAEPPSDAKPIGPLGFVIAIGALLALSMTLPVLAALSSMPGGLISLAIIAFGMQQAWRMTGAPNLVITGPYRIVRSVA